MKRKLFLPFLMSLTVIGSMAQAQTAAPQPKTTNVLVILTAKQGVTREQIVKIMPAEIRATVRLYLDGKIQQWYSRSDGKGVIFLLGSKDVTEAHAIMDSLPLSKENIMDYEFIPVGPLMPLGALLGAAPPQ
jgi:hypothetical protein